MTPRAFDRLVIALVVALLAVAAGLFWLGMRIYGSGSAVMR